jgi:CheY-like chemotaxis protein
LVPNTNFRVGNPSLPAAFSGKSVLLADSVSYRRKREAAYLEAAGCTVFQAGNGHQALVILREPHSRIETVITALEMPDISGINVAKFACRHRGAGIICLAEEPPSPHILDEIDAAGWRYLLRDSSNDEFLRKILSALADLEVVAFAPRSEDSSPLSEQSA